VFHFRFKNALAEYFSVNFGQERREAKCFTFLTKRVGFVGSAEPMNVLDFLLLVLTRRRKPKKSLDSVVVGRGNPGNIAREILTRKHLGSSAVSRKSWGAAKEIRR